MKAKHFQNFSTINILKQSSELADLVLKILSSLALIVGGVWAYFQFSIGGGQDWMNKMTIQAQVLPYQEKLRLVVVHVKSKNPRFVQTDLDPKQDAFKLILRKLPDGLLSGAVIQEDDGEVMKSVDLLPADGSQLSPSAEFDDMVTFVLPVGITVNITAEMDVHNGTKTRTGKADHDFVHVSTVLLVNP